MIGNDGRIYRDNPLPEPTPEFLEAFEAFVKWEADDQSIQRSEPDTTEEAPEDTRPLRNL
jgi:hypothetical protein